jgi:hypothetical protein
LAVKYFAGKLQENSKWLLTNEQSAPINLNEATTINRARALDLDELSGGEGEEIPLGVNSHNCAHEFDSHIILRY